MLDALPHRGPNDRGIHVYRDNVYGHTRLSIVDVASGHQPIVGNGGDSGIICNGEIYNFRALREELKAKYDFRTRSDSEVILHLFREKRPECVKELNGMFALAIFNGDDFMMARDPIGIKPLYYGNHHDRLYFTSELGAMTLAGVDEGHEFPAGPYDTPEEGFVPYYQVPETEDHLLTDIEAASELIGKTSVKAVKDRLLADPELQVGSFYSGCLDSSLVATIAA